MSERDSARNILIDANRLLVETATGETPSHEQVNRWMGDDGHPIEGAPEWMWRSQGTNLRRDIPLEKGRVKLTDN